MHYFDYYSGMMIVSCSEKPLYEDVYLWFDDYKFQISVDDYFLSMNSLLAEADQSSEYADTCILSIIDDTSSFWLVGDSFLKGYYTIHDNDDHANARMGFAPHATSTKSKVVKAAKPTTDVTDVLWETTWIGLMA